MNAHPPAVTVPHCRPPAWTTRTGLTLAETPNCQSSVKNVSRVGQHRYSCLLKKCGPGLRIPQPAPRTFSLGLTKSPSEKSSDAGTKMGSRAEPRNLFLHFDVQCLAFDVLFTSASLRENPGIYHFSDSLLDPLSPHAPPRAHVAGASRTTPLLEHLAPSHPLQKNPEPRAIPHHPTHPSPAKNRKRNQPQTT